MNDVVYAELPDVVVAETTAETFIVSAGEQGPAGPGAITSPGFITCLTAGLTFAARTFIAGTGIAITNPAGFAGDPTFSISPTYAGQSSITTVGTLTSLAVSGVSTFADGSVTAPSIAFTNQTNVGIFRPATSCLAVGINNQGQIRFTQNNDFGAISLTDSTNTITPLQIYEAGGVFIQSNSSRNINIVPATGVVEQRNGVNGQTLRVYNTYTDASNFERLGVAWSSNVAVVATEFLGTGSARQLSLRGGTATSLRFGLGGVSGIDYWQVNASAHFTPVTDNVVDIGDTTHRPRDIYASRDVYFGGTAKLASERVVIQATDTSTSGSPRMVFARFSLAPASVSTTDAINAQFRTTVTTNNGASGRGIRSDLETGANITVPQFVGFEATTALSATAGVLTTGYGFYSSPGTNGTMGTWNGLVAANDIGNVTTHYGFRGLVSSGTTKFNLYLDGTAQNYIGGNVNLTTTATFGWGTTTTPDVVLVRDAANVLAQRNGTNAQILRLYNTYTDASNYERMLIGWSTNTFLIKSEAAGTGSLRAIQLDAGGAAINFAAGGTVFWRFELGTAARALVPFVDNSYDIGASASRPRDIYVGSSVRIGATSSLGRLNVHAFSATNLAASFAANTSAEPEPILYLVTKNPVVQVVGGSDNENFPALISLVQPSFASVTQRAAGINFASSRSTRAQLNAATYTALVANDALGNLWFGGDNGVNVRSWGAQISAFADSTWSNTSTPAYLAFFTAPTGSTTVIERLRITKDGWVGIGAVGATAAVLDITLNATSASWTTNGIGLRVRANTYTDSSTAVSGTAATNHIHAIAAPTLAATNATVTTTNAATLYIAGAPTAGSNMTITNAFSLLVNAGQSGFADGTAALPAITFGADKATGFARIDTGNLVATVQGVGVWGTSGSATLQMASGVLFGWAPGTLLGASSDLVLARDAANTLALRNGTNTQMIRVYGTYTDASNYERLEIYTTAGSSVIRQTQAGTGTARTLSIGTTGNTGVQFSSNNTNRWQIQNDGHFSAITDNTYDIGVTTPLRPRSIYIGSRIVTGAQTVTYSASMTIDASTGNTFTITATNGTAFTINAPTNSVSGQRIVIILRNTSGGALGAATWNAVFKMTAWTNPATANSRSIEFFYNGTNWIEIDRAAADVPN